MRIIGNDPSTPRQAQIVASGTLSTGDTVVVNADGTVSVVEGADQSLGSEVVFEAAQSALMSTVFDSNSNKVVIAYQDSGNSSYGTAVVGTVSGTSISFGTPVVFEVGTTTFISAAFDSNSNKVVIAYMDNSNSEYGTAIVGTVSGTSISFGTPVVFETNRAKYNSAVFDSGSNKVVIAYSAEFNSNYGTAVVGTVSGTSISFGTKVVFESASTGYVSAEFDSGSSKVAIAYRDQGNSNRGTGIVGTVSGTSISFGSATTFSASGAIYLASAFDSNSNNIVVGYQDQGNSNYGTAVVGTVDGTSISFGTPVVFEAATVRFIGAAFDSGANKVVFAYEDQGNSSHGTFAVGTISGTGISFGTPVVFNAASTRCYPDLGYDPNAGKVIIPYMDLGNSNNGTAIVLQNESTNLTAENYIGTAATGAPDGNGAKINLKGAVDENQSGLTAGQSYYVQTDGTLGTTPADPSVFAGTAVAANKLIVKG